MHMSGVKLNRTDITGVDVELTNTCNLKCPLCLSVVSKKITQCKDVFRPHNVDIDGLISLLDGFTSLELVSIAGDASEPTLHPHLFRFLDYLSNRNLEVELYTNASLHDEQYWETLASHIHGKSRVYFTICGTTQEMHEKYRVGSKLADVIRNAEIFRDADKEGHDYMQYIRFRYNSHETEDSILEILKRFSSYGILNTDPVAERFNLIDCERRGICSDIQFSIRYKLMLDDAYRSQDRKIHCYSLENRYVRIDPFLTVSPCVCWRLCNDKQFLQHDGTMDYSSIVENKHDFCYECERNMRRFLEKHDRDAFFMC